MLAYSAFPFGTGVAVLLCLALLFTGCSGQAPAPDPGSIEIQIPKPVIYDTDMAHEDMFALLYLMAHPNVALKAITVTGTGEAHCGPGVANALSLVALSGHPEVPVACGRETPLAGDHAFPIQWRQEADAAYGVPLPGGGEPSPLTAPDLIATILEGSDKKVSIVAVGPLTNVAEAVQEHPEILGRIERVYIMGGAVGVGGNVGKSGAGIENEMAEWNLYVDPQAAGIVLKSGLPITLVPLDATRDVPVTRRFYRALGENAGTPRARLVHEILSANLDFVESGGFQFWDSLTAAIFTDDSLAAFEEMRLTVVEEQGPDSGATRPDPEGAQVRVAVSADREKFERLLLTVLNWNREP
jgi:pyrimidine-specific ribonucleoside hydrolase